MSADLCIVCLGDRDEAECAEMCTEALRRQELRRRIAWLYACARSGVRFARIYREEEGPGGRRERECMEAVFERRREIAALRKDLKKEESTMDETIESIIKDIGAGVTLVPSAGHYEAYDSNYEGRGYGSSALDALRSLRSSIVIRRAEKTERAEAAE